MSASSALRSTHRVLRGLAFLLLLQALPASAAALEGRARQAGLWTDADPTPPWDWRRAKGR